MKITLVARNKDTEDSSSQLSVFFRFDLHPRIKQDIIINMNNNSLITVIKNTIIIHQ